MKQQTPHNTPISASRQLKIEECLQQNMMNLPFERITVADMCRQMGISRRLYYTYFLDKEACLLSLIDRMVQESLMTFSDLSGAAVQLEKTVVDYLTFWKEHSDFLSAVEKQNLTGLVIDRYFLYFKSLGDAFLENLDTPEVKADENILWIYSAVRFTVLMQWHEKNYNPPAEEMAVRYLRMLKRPILPER